MRTGLRFAIGDIIPTTRMAARPMGITAPSGLRADSSSAQVPGTTGVGTEAGAMAVAMDTDAAGAIAADTAASIQDMGSTEAITAGAIRVDTRLLVPAVVMAAGTGEDLVEATVGDLAAVAATEVVDSTAAVAATVAVDTGKV
jgi:hypothetical protein